MLLPDQIALPDRASLHLTMNLTKLQRGPLRGTWAEYHTFGRQNLETRYSPTPLQQRAGCDGSASLPSEARLCPTYKSSQRRVGPAQPQPVLARRFHCVT